MSENKCVCCNTIIPEGRQVCWQCEHVNEVPSADQVKVADIIAETLNIDFPQSSEDYTKETYCQFIKDNIKSIKNYWERLASFIEINGEVE